MGDSQPDSAPRKKRFALAGAAIFALVVALWLAWLWGLFPKGYRPVSAVWLRAYSAEPNAECAQSPTPECLLAFGEAVFRDGQELVQHDTAIWETLGKSYAETGDFEAADAFVDWYLSTPIDVGVGEWSKPYFVEEKLTYLLEQNKWSDAFALLGLVENSYIACQKLEWLAEEAVVHDLPIAETEALVEFADLNCESKDEVGIEHSLERYRLARSASPKSLDDPEYHYALMNALTGYDGRAWYLPISYCQALQSIDYRLIEPESWVIDLIPVYWNAGLGIKVDEVIEYVLKKGVLEDWSQSFASEIGYFQGAQDLAWHVVENHLDVDNLSRVARDLAGTAAFMGDEAMVDRLWEYLDERGKEYSKKTLEHAKGDAGRRFGLELRKLADRQTRGIREDALDQAHEMAMRRLRRPVSFLPFRYHLIPFDEAFDHGVIIRALFRYGRHEQGFELMRELSYHPIAVSAAVDGLLLQRKPGNRDWSGNCGETDR